MSINHFMRGKVGRSDATPLKTCPKFLPKYAYNKKDKTFSPIGCEIKDQSYRFLTTWQHKFLRLSTAQPKVNDVKVNSIVINDYTMILLAKMETITENDPERS